MSGLDIYCPRNHYEKWGQWISIVYRKFHTFNHENPVGESYLVNLGLGGFLASAQEEIFFKKESPRGTILLKHHYILEKVSIN